MRSALFHNVVFNSNLDPDVKTFIEATGISDPTQKKALNDLTLSLKSSGVWPKMHLLYPFVGGNAVAHSYNLKNIANNRITWNGTVTHNSTGVTSDGSSGFGTTGYTLNSGLQNNFHLSAYIRNNSDTGGTIGAISIGGGIKACQLYPRTSNLFDVAINSDNTDSVANADSRGYYIASRTGATTVNGYKNGTNSIVSTRVSNTVTPFPFYVLAINRDGVTFAYSLHNVAFASAGEGLSSLEATALNSAVQQFEQTLSRQV